MAFNARKKVTKIDQETSKAHFLILWHDHNAGYIVLLLTGLLLGKIPHQVTSLAIVLGQDVEQKGLNIVVQGLVVQEELGEKTEVLAVDFTDCTVHLVNGDVVFPVYLVGGRMEPLTLGSVAIQDITCLHVLDAKLTNVQRRQHGILLRVGGGEPRLDQVLSELNHRRRAHTA